MTKKLLSQDLHHLFNATIVLLLNQLLDDNLEAQDSLDISFVIGVFKEESNGERREYPKDCARVLEDLKALIQRLRNQTLDDQGNMRNAQSTVGEAMYDVNGQQQQLQTSGMAAQRTGLTSSGLSQRHPLSAPGSASPASSTQQQQLGHLQQHQQHHNGNISHAPVTTTAYDVGYILNQDIPQNLLTLHPQLAYNNNALYSVLHGWMDYDDFHLYNHRLG